MSHAVNILKLMFLHSVSLENTFCPYPTVISPISKVVSYSSTILFNTILAQQRMNKTVAVTIEFTIYLMSLVTLLVNLLVSETFKHNSYRFLSH